MLKVLHDEVDASEDFRERASEIVNNVRENALEVAKDFLDSPTGVQDLLMELALLVENEAAKLTTEASKKFFEFGRERTRTAKRGGND